MKGDKFLVLGKGIVHIERNDSGWSYCDKWHVMSNEKDFKGHHKVCRECLEEQEKDNE